MGSGDQANTEYRGFYEMAECGRLYRNAGAVGAGFGDRGSGRQRISGCKDHVTQFSSLTGDSVKNALSGNPLGENRIVTR